MKIKLVGFYDGLHSIGLRRLDSYIRQSYEDVELYLYNVNGYKAMLEAYFFKSPEPRLNHEFTRRVAGADVIGVSCMSNYSPLASEFIRKVKEINPSCYIVWGGPHAIMTPESCFPEADAACVGEGEEAFVELLNNLYSSEKEKIEGFWFKTDGEIRKNNYRALNTPEKLSTMPYQNFSEDIVYVDNYSMNNLDAETYLSRQGTNYVTVWSLGCPFQCSYCGNGKFIENDSKYAKLRYPLPEYIVGEIKHVVDKYDFVSFIEIMDDNFFLIRNEDIVKFAALYKREVGLPFNVPGIFPGTVKHEKTLDLLVDAGLRKVKMGIESGSKETLKIFNRPTTKEQMTSTARLLISKYPRINPPDFDVIIDIPFEDGANKNETLDLLGSLDGPIIPLIYSLRTTPGTSLRRYAEEHPELGMLPLESSFRLTEDKEYALKLYHYGLGKPSKLGKKIVERISKNRLLLPSALKVFVLLSLGRRLYYDLKVLNFSTLGAVAPIVVKVLYRLKLLRFLKNWRNGVPSFLHQNPRKRLLTPKSDSVNSKV